MIAALTACTLGIPLPLQVQKTVTEPFPCMNCPCGCKTAEKCWRDCCCHTHAEKLAWARDNGVTPPAYVLAAVEVPTAAKQPSCCSKKNTTKTCCSSSTKSNCCGNNARQGRSTSSTLLVFQALRCQGLTSSLTALPPTILPQQVAHTLSAPPVGEATLSNEPLTPSPLAIPDTPPPQFV